MYILTIAAFIAASSASSIGASKFIQGNWYSNAVDSFEITNWGTPGTYQEVVNMSDGQCIKSLVSYGGGMAPLNNEVSLHFRGPMHLKSFAFYAPGPSGSKRDMKPFLGKKRHSHDHNHRHLNRAVGDWVTVTMNGQVVSWVNQYAGPSTAISAAEDSTTSRSSSVTISSKALPTVSTPSPTPNAALPNIIAQAGTWGRQAYYNATIGSADGLVLLNHHGGQESGIFDYEMGMSLSYASSDGQTGAASPQILADTLLDDQVEIVIYTDKQCEGTSCGVYRPGSVAYHGFDGDSKLFLIEFDMPHSNAVGTGTDMPAIWILNAAIPRTQQYGGCSCWPECGEWDIFEILNHGNTRAKTTLHAGEDSSGPNQYFERPVNKTMKVAVVFDGSSSSSYIFVLPDDTTFGTLLTDEEVADLGSGNGLTSDISAKFVLGS